MAKDTWADKMIRAAKGAEEREKAYERATKAAEAARTSQPQDSPTRNQQ